MVFEFVASQSEHPMGRITNFRSHKSDTIRPGRSRKPNATPHETVDRILDLYRLGAKPKDIAEIVGVLRGSVHYYISKAIGNAAAEGVDLGDPATLEALRLDYAAGIGFSALRRKYGLDRAAISAMAYDSEWPRPTSKFAGTLACELRHNAGARGHEYDLDESDVANIVLRPCHYCGAKWSREVYGMRVNGIDRVDNSRGYVIDNCVPCCTRCNWMKRDMSVGDFIGHIHSIAEHTKS